MSHQMQSPPRNNDNEANFSHPHPSFPTPTPTVSLAPSPGGGRSGLPTLAEAERLANKTYSSRHSFLGITGNGGKGLARSNRGISAGTASGNINIQADSMAENRTQLLQTMAMRLSKTSLDRQSNVFPIFVKDPETKQVHTLPEEEKRFFPEKSALMVPALGIAAGANAMGGYSQRFAMSREEAEEWMKKERESNRVIFSWWETRNACRQDEEEIAAVESELRGPLWSFFRQSITEEEAQCILELKQMRESSRSHMLPLKQATSRIKKGINGNVLRIPSSPSSLPSTDRGISMPLEFYEGMFSRVMSRMHRQFLNLLRCQATGEADSIEIQLESRSQGTKYAQFLLKCQTEMIEAGKMLSKNGDSGEIYLPMASIPGERCFRPMLEAETAFAVTLLWRILDQTKNFVPGMSWAVQLFSRYVLPHVYENFISYEQQLPKAGAIGEQVEQLHALPLNLVRQRAMAMSTKQAKDDLHYMEGFLKSWAWRTWRRGVMGQKQREVAMELLENKFRRLHNMIWLRKCFSEWRLTAKEGQFSAQLDVVEAKYAAFLSGASHAAREIQLFPDWTEGVATGDSAAILDKNKFVAIKLAETAQHTKMKKKISIKEPESAQKQKGEGKDNSDNNKKGGREEEASSSERKPAKKSVLLKMALSEPEPTETPSEQSKTDEGKTPFAYGMLSNRETFITSLSPTKDGDTEITYTQKRVITTFDSMLRKLQEMETISGYLRQEIAIQNRLVQKLERENNSLKSKTRDLEGILFHSEKQRLFYSNLAQERELDVRELERRIMQLKSRLRCQKHRPWQRTLMRVVGDICGASTSASEYADECRVARNMISAPTDVTSANTSTTHAGIASVTNFADSCVAGASTTSTTTRTFPPPMSTKPPPTAIATPGGFAGSAVVGGIRPEASITDESERNRSVSGFGNPHVLQFTPDEERLFGKIAPLVIVSTRDMPDSQTILRDWANGCLEDLESLDDLKGGALSSRFHNFSDEVRNGVLFSRLLFYLALPRYKNKMANTGVEDMKRKASSAHLDFTEHRRHLLMQQNVQLESPFPTYSECFGDLLNLVPSGRMSLLLQFATELMEGLGQMGDAYIQKRLAQIRETAIKATEMTPLPAVERVEMLEILDPYALARGDRGATITFIALLYVRFSHPFNHKAKQSALIEREAMLHVLSDGSYSKSDLNTVNETSGVPDSGAKQQGEGEMSLAREFLAQLEEEDRTPWQLFLNYCKPLINALAHPFILRGNFWPSLAFDSPELACMLGSIGLALHRSLELHRWHIIVSCLVPVQTFSGLSRGIFTGHRASPLALQTGLDRDGDWVFAMGMPCIQEALQQREVAIREAIHRGTLGNVGGGDTWIGDGWENEGYFIEMDKSHLMSVFNKCSNDILQLFLQRGSLSGVCAMPSLDLGSWRLLWLDLGLVIPDDVENSVLDLEQLTRIFCLVTSSALEPQREARASESRADTSGSEQLPQFTNFLYFPEFLVAMVLLAHEMFPVLGDPKKLQEGNVVWLADALSQLVFKYVSPMLLTRAAEDPGSVMRGLRANIKIQEILMRHNKALLVLFNSYSKEVCGVSGMEREQLLQMLRDAMLTSTEISQNLIYELFAPFSTTKRTDEASKEDKRREQDSRPHDTKLQRRRGNVSIVDPSSEIPVATGKPKEAAVLLYDGFIQFLCVLCHFKQPNPLIPFEQRLETFLRRGLFRPLSQRNDALLAVISSEKKNTRQDT